MKSRANAVALSVLLIGCGLSAQERPNTVFLEELTWTEVRDAIRAGTTTIIVPTGGTEQNGPHMVLGKHNYVINHTSELIARELGNALVVPVIKLVPEGDPESIRYPGTLSLRQETFRLVLEDVVNSLKSQGFTNIVLIGDSGGNQRGMGDVAAMLNNRWVDVPARVHFVGDYYSANGFVEWMIEQGETEEAIGRHAGIKGTSQVLYVAPEHIRHHKLAPWGGGDGSGVSGDPTRASAEYGRKGIQLKVEAAVRQIHALIGLE